ncbi:major facilitator superfamily domain-containing protein [Amylocarpus encephaloides]|uniref:Major facilitator superfamily domain-containing protein n=1 Tax=Amylocarpus encephaloides TaxID=45428 RepID=A0A9P7YPF7_9HELO|nr:major facilitator superfamily domain-containing protein [Amylocarpus encephaloides]
MSAIELHPLTEPSRTPSLSSKDVLGPENIRDETEPPRDAVDALPRWNYPKVHMWRTFAAFWSFFVVGMNDGSYGLEEYYSLNYTIVSLIFLSPFAGYSLAAITNNLVHIRLGQRGVAIIGPCCHLISYIVLALHPPYAVLVVMFIFVGFGNGLIDAAWCAWLANMANANQIAGFLHCFYAVGATAAPLVATGLFSRSGVEWYYYYYILIGTSFIELATSTLAFWTQTGARYCADNPSTQTQTSGRTREAIKYKLTWIFALFIFGYMGAEVSLGGWIVVFMTKLRSATSFQSGATATGFWAGMAVGRVVLGFVTARLGEFRSVLVYIGISIGLELVFWLVPNLIVSAVAVALLGAFLGPLFPTAMVLVTKMMPRHLHVGSVGFAAAIGGSGGAIFPFLVGAIAQEKGVESLQPVILSILVLILGLWVSIPWVGKRMRGVESAMEGGRAD